MAYSLTTDSLHKKSSLPTFQKIHIPDQELNETSSGRRRTDTLPCQTDKSKKVSEKAISKGQEYNKRTI
jgi:hypothetical protein